LASLLVFMFAMVLMVGSGLADTVTETYTTEYTLDGISRFVPCANGGAGEMVDMSGVVQELYHLTQISHDIYKVHFTWTPQGVTAIGQTTGDIYRSTGASSYSTQVQEGHVVSDVEGVRLIGPGPDNNLTFRYHFHITITPSGEATSYIEDIQYVCN
jgi:hypothetical protein